MSARAGDGGPARVVVLVKRFPRLSETFIMNEFLELRRQGLEVELYAIMDPHEDRSHPEAFALVPEVVYLQTGSIFAALPAVARTVRRHPWGALRAIGWTITRHSRAAVRNCIHAMVLVDRMAEGEPGGRVHLHAHFLHSPAAIAFIARKLSGQRYSLSGHAKDIYTTLPENLRMRCRDAEFVTTCTEANQRYLVDEIGLGAGHVRLCRHGVDIERFGATSAGARAPGRILSIGRLVPKKGFDVLIQACGELRRRGVSFELRIVGGGQLRSQLLALAEAEGVSDLIELTGSMSQSEIVAELAAAELFALSPVVLPDGDRDGIPNVLLEAMAAGVPVIAAAVSGIPEVLSDTINARLVPPSRSDLLADALQELLADQAQRDRLAASGRRFVEEQCAWPNVVAPLRKLLSDAGADPVEPVATSVPALAS
ncbi:MAG: glycosyltransferase family 4 protein [Solirubrobacteraceae bacterium]